MKKSTAIILAAALLFMAVGAGLIAAAWKKGDIRSGAPFSDTVITVTHEATGDFRDIKVCTSSADVTVKASSDGRTYAVCGETERITFTLTVENGALVLRENRNDKWYNYIGIFVGSREAVLYLPSGEYGALTVTTASGTVNCTDTTLAFENAAFSAASGNVDVSAPVAGKVTVETASGIVTLSDLDSDTVSVTTASGNVFAMNCTASHIGAETASGKVTLESVIASDELAVNTVSGDIGLWDCDGGSIDINSTSGKVTASLLTDKLFTTRSTSGNITCPPSIKDGDPCRIITTSGSISVEIAQ